MAHQIFLDLFSEIDQKLAFSVFLACHYHIDAILRYEFSAVQKSLTGERNLLGFTVSGVYNNLFLLRVNMTTYYLIAFLTVATLGLSNSAVAHLNFTTFCMFKSSKLIPVMIGSVLILGIQTLYYLYEVEFSNSF